MLSELATVGSEAITEQAKPDQARASSAGVRFDEIYRKHAGFVWRVLRGMGIGEPAIEDAVQDVFVVVHRRLPEWNGRASITTWLFEIAYRVACEQRRKHVRARTHEELSEDLQASGPSPQHKAEQQQELELLARVLDGLTDEQRVVLVLTEIEGMTAPEISAATGAALNNVYARLRRARIAVDKALAAQGRRGP